jgi:hypothetical protein
MQAAREYRVRAWRIRMQHMVHGLAGRSCGQWQQNQGRSIYVAATLDLSKMLPPVAGLDTRQTLLLLRVSLDSLV